MQSYFLRPRMAFTFSRFMMRKMERYLIFARPSKHFSKAHGVRNNSSYWYYGLICCGLDRIWPRSSDLPGLPWSELNKNPKEYFHPSFRLESTITNLHPEKMSPADLRSLSSAVISFQSNTETASSAIFQSRDVISKARNQHLLKKEVESVDAQEPQEIFDHSRSVSPCIASTAAPSLEVAGTSSLSSPLDQSPSFSATSAPQNLPATSTPNINKELSSQSPPMSPPLTPNHISLDSGAYEPCQSPSPTPARFSEPGPSGPLLHTPSPPHLSPSSPDVITRQSTPVQPPPISTMPQPHPATVPSHIQSPPTSEPQKRKRSIFDEAPPADLGKRNRKISKKAQGLNFDAKSGDEGKGGGSVSQSTAKNGRGGRSGSRVGGKGVSSKGRKRSD